MKSLAQEFWDAIAWQVERYGMLTPGEGWLLAVSGGADSMAMLHAAAAMRQGGRLAGLQAIFVAHLNHRLRGAESDADAEFVRQAAAGMGFEAVIESVDAAENARRNQLSIETAARNCRYDFLARAARQCGCGAVALAHNADDQVETILHRIVRGTGVSGLAGMPAVRALDAAGERPVRLIRPMLALTRRQIEQYLAANHISFRQDASNLSEAYTRNRIRRTLLPMLREQFNPQVDQAIGRLGHIAEMLALLSAEQADEAMSAIVTDRRDDGLTLDVNRLSAMPPLAHIELIFSVLRELKIPQCRIGFKQLTALFDLMGEKSTAEKAIQWPDGVRIIRRGGELIFQTQSEEIGGHAPPYTCGEIMINVPGVTVLPGDCGFITAAGQPIRQVTAELIDNRPGLLEQFIREKTPNEEMVDFDKLDTPLCLRVRQACDTFRPLGSGGTKTIGDFFTDSKIPVSRRDGIALLCDRRDILWVTGLRLTDTVRVIAATGRIVKISVR